MTDAVLLGLLLTAHAGTASSTAPPAEDRDEERVGAILDALERWDMAAAATGVNALAAVKPPPDEGLLHELQGRLRFSEGDYAGAAEVLKGSNSPMAELATATVKETEGYEQRKSPHFVLSFPSGKDAILADYALETLEAARERIGADLGFLPSEPIRVEILRDPRALSRMSPLTEVEILTSGTIALCKYNKLMIVSPRALVKGYAWQDTLAHELTHYLIARKSLNKTPIWIHEGIAKYEETRWRGPAGEALTPAAAALLARRLTAGTLISFEKMHPSIAMLKSQEDAALAFAEVFTIVEYLIKERHASLERLLSELGRGTPETRAVELVAGESFERVTRDWKVYLKKRPVPKDFLPLEPEKLTFRAAKSEGAAGKVSQAARPPPEPATDESELDSELKDPNESNARKHAHLGALLFARARKSAATVELGQAEQRVGARSPALSNLYAHALLDADRDAEAERVLRASLVPFPDIAQTHLRLAEVKIRGAQWQEAHAELLAANAVDPFDPVIHLALLRVADAQKDDATATREKSVIRILRE